MARMNWMDFVDFGLQMEEGAAQATTWIAGDTGTPRRLNGYEAEQGQVQRRKRGKKLRRGCLSDIGRQWKAGRTSMDQ